MSRTHKLINLAGIVLPFIGLVAAIVLLWDRMVGPTELAILAVGYLLTGVGITVGYHRLFTHRSFETYRPVRYTFAVLGQMAVEGDVLAWVSDHRKHHQFSDQEGDPHSPHAGYGGGVVEALRGLWHAHTGWLFSESGRADQARYAKDLLRDTGLRVIARALPPARHLLAASACARRLGADRRLVRLFRRALLGRRRPDLPAPPRHLLDQLDLPLLGPSPFRLARRVTQRLVALLALLRRVLAQQPPRLPDLGLPRATEAGDRSRRLGDLDPREARARLGGRPDSRRQADGKARGALGGQALELEPLPRACRVLVHDRFAARRDQQPGGDPAGEHDRAPGDGVEQEVVPRRDDDEEHQRGIDGAGEPDRAIPRASHATAEPTSSA